MEQIIVQIGLVCNILICMQKHSQHNKDNRTQFMRKIYLTLYSKGLRKDYERVIVWEVSWRLNKDCNILTPTLLAIAAFLSRSPGLLNRGPGAKPLLGLVLTPRTGTLISNSDLQLTDFLSHPGYIIIWHPPASCAVTIRTQFNPSTVKVIPRYLRPVAPIIYTGAFLIWQFGRVGGQYVTGWDLWIINLCRLFNGINKSI